MFSDSVVDPAAAILQVGLDGKPRIVDVLDWYLSMELWKYYNWYLNFFNVFDIYFFYSFGSGDIDASKLVNTDEDGCIRDKSFSLSCN